jgi:hypothetical protein
MSRELDERDHSVHMEKQKPTGCSATSFASREGGVLITGVWTRRDELAPLCRHRADSTTALGEK